MPMYEVIYVEKRRRTCYFEAADVWEAHELFSQPELGDDPELEFFVRSVREVNGENE